jgi:hypothetical protein
MSCSRSQERPIEDYAPQIDPMQFTASIDNAFFPLTPGTTLVYEQADGSERVEVHVLDQVRNVMDVPCRVVKSLEYEDGELVEETFDWYAQDAEGDVWYFGEDTRTFENGAMTRGEGSWEAGVDGAQPGIIMKARPAVGDSYRQEYYAERAEDMGEVLALVDSVTVPYGSFSGVLVTRDWTPLEPGVEERKYYAPGLGLVLEVEGSSRVALVRVETSESDMD